MMFKIKPKKGLLISICSIVLLFVFFIWQNNSIIVNNIEFKNSSLPEAFIGYRILHISDLHNKEFGSQQRDLLKKIKNINPDVIFITGDLIDANNINIDVAMDLIDNAIKIAPLFYISGNHEAWSGSYEILKAALESSGVLVLENQREQIFYNNEYMDVIGLVDKSFNESEWLVYGDKKEESILNSLTSNSSNFKILLSHRPELFDTYIKSNVELVFSGHAHGGQFRIPFIGGIVAPDQGFFPKLTEGIHTSNNTSMIISRGLGNSIIPIRVFNRPELIVVTLSK